MRLCYQTALSYATLQNKTTYLLIIAGNLLIRVSVCGPKVLRTKGNCSVSGLNARNEICGAYKMFPFNGMTISGDKGSGVNEL